MSSNDLYKSLMNKYNDSGETNSQEPPKSSSTGHEQTYQSLIDKYNPEIDDDYVKRFTDDVDSFFNKYGTDVGYVTGKNIYDQNSDTLDDLNTRARILSRYFENNAEQYENPEQVVETIARITSDLKKYGIYLQDQQRYYSQFESENDYNWYEKYNGNNSDDLKAMMDDLEDGDEKTWLDAYTRQVYNEELKNLDINAARAKVAGMEELLNTYRTNSRMVSDVNGQAWWEELKPKLLEYGGVEGLEQAISRENQRIQLATRMQENIRNQSRFAGVEFRPDFAEKSVFDPANTEIGYRYINGDAWDRFLLEDQYGQYAEEFGYHAYDSLTDEEKAVYNYFMNTGDRESAADYLRHIQDPINQRKAQAVFEDGFKGHAGREFVYGWDAGLDQFRSGAAGFGAMIRGDTAQSTPSATQYASAMMREDLGENGKKLPEWLGGGTVGQAVYDSVTTTANMAPSILASTVIGLINPTAGAWVGSAMMGASAAGSAYQEMIDSGYSVSQARTYGSLVGAAELVLDKILGGITKLGSGSSLASAITRWAGNVDNALINLVGRIGGNALSEGAEEALQEVVSGWIQSEVTKEDFYAKPADVIYSGLLGAVTGALFESPDAGIDVYQRTSQGQNVIRSGGVQTLTDMGKASGNTDIRRLAERTARKPSAYNVGGLSRQVSDEIHSQNVADISKQLAGNGMKGKAADQMAEVIASVLENGSESDIRLLASETDPIVAKTMRQVQMKGTALWQRMQQLRGATGKSRSISQVAAAYGNQANDVKAAYIPGQDVDTFAHGFEQAHILGREGGNAETLGQVAPDLAASQRKIAYDMGRAAAAEEKAAVTKRMTGEASVVYRLNEDGSTGDAVRIEGVESTEGGKWNYRLSDGQVVGEDQLSFSGDQAVLDTVKDLNLDPKTASVLISGNNTISQPDAAVAQGIEDAYRYGSHGYSMERLLKDSEAAGILTEEMRQAAYDAGKNKPAKAKPSKAKPKTRGTKPGVYFDNGNGQVQAYDLKSTRQLKDTQKAGVQTAVVLQKLGIGTDFYFFESYVKDGKRVYRDEKGVERPAPNGWYDKTDGSIHIDLNAGNGGQGLTLYTMAHELTHFIEQWSQDKYKVLADFLIKNYEKGRSVDDLVHLKQQTLSEERGKPVSYEEAYSEVIADSMEAMLSDGNVLEKLAELKAKDEGLVRKMKAFFDSFVKKIRSIYADLEPESAEGQLVQEMKEQFEQLQQLFAEALADAGENYRDAAEVDMEVDADNESHVDRQYSIRRDIVDVNGKEYENVVELDYNVFNRIKRHTKSWLNFIRNNLIKQKITVYNSNGDPEIIEFAKENERVKKDGSTSFRRVLGELERITGDTRKLVVANAVEVTEISAWKEHKVPDGHQWLDQNGWDERHTYVMTSDGIIHTAVLQIAKTRDGRNILYGVNVDITEGVRIDKNATSVRAKMQAQPAVKIQTPSDKQTVTQPEKEVNHNIQRQDRPTAPITNRALLANALESTTQDETELTRLREYRMSIDYLNEQEAKLTELRSQIREISFGKGPRDTARLKQLQEEATKTANRINVADKKLLRLEAAQPLQRVLERERGKAYRQAQDRNKEVLARRQEGRNKTAVRHKIQRVVNELNKLLLNGDKKNHVPENLKKAVADALALVNMDTVGLEERIARYQDLIANETDPDKIDAYTVTMENLQRKGDQMGQRLKDLRDAYEEFQKSDDPDIANAYDPVIAGSLQELAGSIGNTALKDMSMEQLQDVYDMYTMVLTRVRDSNKSFQAARNQSIAERSAGVVREIRAVGGDHKMRAAILDPVRKFFWNNLKPVYAFETIGSGTLQEAFNAVRKGEDVWAVDVSEARKFYLEKAKKYGYNSWDFKKKYRFESESGQSFELTLEQILSLYAYSRRAQAHEHLRLGGFVFDSNIETYKEKGSKLVKYRVNTAEAHQIDPETLTEIIGTLSKDQIAFVEDMQGYLSDTMGAKGNEVTMQMYGVKLFREKNYFPLKSAKQFMFEQNEVSGEVKLKNSGFTNKLVAKANNPVILSNFMDVWAGHVNDMSMYHAFVLPLEDFNRIFNYNSPKKENIPSVSVKGTLQNAYGPASVSYVKELITDLNGGARTDSTTGPINKLMGMFKKGAVFASASVVVQQPSAVARAAAVMDLKWFVGGKIDRKRHDQLWEEVKRYAPVAVIKEMGYFDTNMGKSSLDYITGREYDGFWEKAKATITDSDFRDELLSRAPAYADEVAWCAIWDAVKRETRSKNPGMDTKSDIFLRKAGERFTEVITKTQVYDSVLARSANMRSKDTGMKMATAFMAEPTTSINMVADALLKGKRGDKATSRKVIGAVVASQILNAFLVAWVYAARDDDDEKTYWEKYVTSFLSSVMDGVNPLTYIPFIKDIVSIVQGYDVERSDMAVISDLWNAWQQLQKDNVSAWRKVEGFVGSICQILGLPVKNIMRDVRAIWQVYDTIVNGESGTETGMRYARQEGLGKDVPNNAHQLYYARRDGDTEHAARVESRYDDADSADAAVRSAIRELYLSGELDLVTARNHLVTYGGMKVDEAHWTMDEWKYRKEMGTDDGYGKYNAFHEAVRTGENLEDTIKTYTENGVSKDTLRRQITETFKPEYVKAPSQERERLYENLITAYQACGMDPEEAEDKLWEWEFEAEYGFTWSDRKQAYWDGKVTGPELQEILIDIGDYEPDMAAAQVEAYDWEAEGLEGATPTRVKEYNLYCKATRLSRETYLAVMVFSAKTENDVDEEGNTIKYSAVEKIMAEMGRLGLTLEQKEAMVLCFGWGKNTIKHITRNNLW